VVLGAWGLGFGPPPQTPHPQPPIPNPQIFFLKINFLLSFNY